MKITFSYLLFLVLYITSINVYGQDFDLTIKLKNSLTNEPLPNANIFIMPCSCGGASNENGELTIKLKQGEYTVRTSYVGFNENLQNIVLEEDTILEVFLEEENEVLSEVVVRAKKRNELLESPQMGVLQLNAQEIKKMPAALGEFDVLRSVTLMPGVNNSGEISNGISVRGGSLDQNLLLYDYAPVFNPTHLFGLFSVFTPDALSSVDIYRANIPARYGGRSTSVLDIKVRNPYVDKFKLSGGVGLVSSRLTVETPLVKDKLMVMAGIRAGLSDFLLPIFSERLKNTKARFYDSTMKLLYLPTEKDQISFTGFYSKDFYQLDLITKVENINAENNQYDFKTLNGTLNWSHTFNEKVSLKTIFVASNYSPKNIFPELENTNEIEYKSGIHYLSLISEVSKKVSDKLDYYTGVQLNNYKINPGELDPGLSNGVLPVNLLEENSYELSGYANANWKPKRNLTLSAGLRYNYFQFNGPYVLNNYDEAGEVVLESNFIEKGKKVKSYNNLEPRLGVNFKIDENTSVKASYANANQYLQNVYNSTTPLPTSRWKTSDSFIKPQSSNAYGLGVYKDLKNNEIEVGVEGYFRSSKNNLTYRPGADFFLAESIEQSVAQVEGKAYGVELSFKKKVGNVNGWLNYTWSRSLLRSDEENLSNRINNNNWFSSDFDRPHIINASVNIIADKYNTVSFNFTGQTGRPYTIANGVFEFEDINVPIFLERNNDRLPTYHRLDFSWKVSYSKKKNPRWVGDWTFTVYNVYGRKNAYSRFYSQRDGNLDKDFFGGFPLGSYQLEVSNSPILALTYNFTFL
ncbi:MULTISPECIES: TonB-dependent receptor [unclassified Maribacter]|uniref:TonB-dependent receptor n=1 Tax=unclassified Maribacter TaxID=2615042 RepID=UPI00257CBB3E|nr:MULTISPECIES: TonB-dependent receptor [unclassified Maribacter]|tara:strand:- start:28438 stop:30849 length:2412 start_codon:yes stop_codon:yes gene_type:complete